MVNNNHKLSKVLSVLPTVQQASSSNAETLKEQVASQPQWPLILIPSKSGIISKPLMLSTQEEFFAWARTLGYGFIETGQILTPLDLKNMFDQIVYIATIKLLGAERDSRVGHA